MAKWRGATMVIAIATILVSLLIFALGATDDMAFRAGFIPARFSGAVQPFAALPAWLTPFSATLIHGNFLHLLLNMIMLVWIGAQVERVLGAGAVIVCYLAGALLAALAQWGWDPRAIEPMIGASGAISALVGAYALMFGVPKPVTGRKSIDRAIHALWLMVAWVVLQWLSDYLAAGEGVQLATPAHIGGFVAGLLLQRPLLLWRYRRA